MCVLGTELRSFGKTGSALRPKSHLISRAWFLKRELNLGPHAGVTGALLSKPLPFPLRRFSKHSGQMSFWPTSATLLCKRLQVTGWRTHHQGVSSCLPWTMKNPWEGHLLVLRWVPSYSILEALEWCCYGNARSTFFISISIYVSGAEMLVCSSIMMAADLLVIIVFADPDLLSLNLPQDL